MRFSTVAPFLLVTFALGGFANPVGGTLPIKTEGKLYGILSAKGAAWIEVKADAGFIRRYLPRWHGGPPERGGGFDYDTLGEFGSIAVGNRVRLFWEWDGNLRVRDLKILRPFRLKGVETGVVLAKGDKWIDLLPASGIPDRYYARWIGGLPERGGGYHEPTLDTLGGIQLAETVELAWSYDQRKRIIAFRGKHAPKAKAGFVPFYESGKPIIGLPASPAPEPPPVPSRSPFDMIPPSGPNPFDQVLPSVPASPFDQVDPENAVPVPANPLDQPPAATTPVPVNPFDLTPDPADPFAP